MFPDNVSSHINRHNYHSAKYMTDNSDDMLLARLGEVGCQERTHIESHLTEHNRGLAEIQQEWENTLMLYFSTVMEKGKTQQEWEEVGRNTPNVGKNTKRGK